MAQVMSEVVKCPACGGRMYKAFFAKKCGNCQFQCDAVDIGRISAAMEAQAHLDELRERVAWMLECEYVYRMRDFLTCGWAQIEIDYSFHNARKAVEDLL